MDSSAEQQARLLKELEHLEKSFKAGIVNEAEFLKGKDRIEGKLKNIQKEQREKEAQAHVLQELLDDRGDQDAKKIKELKKEKYDKNEKKIKFNVESKAKPELPKREVREVKKAIDENRHRGKDKKDVVKIKNTKEHKKEWILHQVSSATWYSALLLIVLVGIFLITQWTSPKLTMEVYIDVTCSHCKAFHATLKQIQEEYPLAIIYKHYPLTPHSFYAAEAYECAVEQGHGQDYLEQLYSRPILDNETYYTITKDLEMNLARFNDCLEKHRATKKINENIEEARQRGVEKVPTFFIENQKIVGARSKEVLKGILDQIQ